MPDVIRLKKCIKLRLFGRKSVSLSLENTVNSGILPGFSREMRVFLIFVIRYDFGKINYATVEVDSADRFRVGTFPVFVSNRSGCRQFQ